jgi:hypothetical protein
MIYAIALASCILFCGGFGAFLALIQKDKP